MKSMIYVFFGENEFLKRQNVCEIVGDAAVQRRDGEELSVGDLRELLTGQTLFGGDEPVIITDLSQNAEVWAVFPEIAVLSDRTVILLETKLDKRTKAYKQLGKIAILQECAPLSERQRPELVKWALARAKEQGAELSRQQIETLIDRLGYDQLRLDAVFAQLALADEITNALIDQFVPLAKSESVFELFDAAIRGDVETVHRIIAYLEMTSGDDGAYQTMGLLGSQVTNLYALALADGDVQAVAKDFGAHPFALRQLTGLVRQLDRTDMARISAALAEADMQMKTTGVAPWLLVEAALVRVARRL